MTTAEILSVIDTYERILLFKEVPKIRMDGSKKFADLSKDEILEHAHYLCDVVNELAKTPGKKGETGRYLGFLQACLSFAGMYTLSELKDHNRSSA